MPIYEYICKDCNTRFEIIRSIQEADYPILCRHCQSENTIRAISSFFSKSSSPSATSSSSCSGCSGGSCAHCH